MCPADQLSSRSALPILQVTLLLLLLASTAAQAQPVAFATTSLTVVEQTAPVWHQSPQIVDLVVQRIDGGVGDLTVDVLHRPETATECCGSGRTDYLWTESYPSPLFWADGDVSTRTVSTQIFADGVLEGDEFFEVWLRDAGSGTVFDTATVTIEDDDSEVRFVGFSTPQERDGSVILTLERIGRPIGAISVDYVTSDQSTFEDETMLDWPRGTPGVDFPVVTGQLQWADGDASQRTLEVFFFDDCILETQFGEFWEIFFVNLTPNGFSYPVVDAFGTSFPINESTGIRVDEDDLQPRLFSFETPTAAAAEGQTTSVLVRREGSAHGAASVEVTPGSATATAGVDYSLAGTVLQWADGELGTRSVTLEALSDGLFEGPEIARLQLVNSAGLCMAIGAGTADVQIVDADGPPTVGFSTSALTVLEDAGVVELEVSRAGSLDGAVSVDFAAVELEATEGTDFALAPGSLTWADGEGGARSIFVTILPDTEFEGAETLRIELSNPQGASLGANSSLLLTIDETTTAPTVQFTRSVFDVGERLGSAEITLTLSRPAAVPITATVATTGGSATAGEDFELSQTAVSWAAGESGDKVLLLELLDDLMPEPVESIELEIANLSDGEIGDQDSAQVRILDDDVPVSPELRVSGLGGTRSQIAAFRDGGSVVVFQFFDGFGSGVFARLVDADGTARPAFRVHASEQGNQSWPDVAVAPGGDFVVTWINEADPSQPAAAGESIRARRFARRGQALADEFSLSSEDVGVHRQLAVSIDGAGEVLYSWRVDSRLLARRTNAQDLPLGGAVDIASSDFGECRTNLFGDDLCAYTTSSGTIRWSVDQRNGRSADRTPGPSGELALSASPRITPAGSSFVMAFDDLQSGEARPSVLLFDSTGEPGLPVPLSTIAGNRYANPRVAASSTGDFAVAMEDIDALQIRVRLFDRRGRAAAGDFLLASDAGTGIPDLQGIALSNGDRLFVSYSRIDPADNSLGLYQRSLDAAVGDESCDETQALCLNDGRFRAEATFRANFESQTGEPIALTTDSGYHWFFEADNVELVTKVLDACAVNDRYWVFSAGLTDVAVHLVIEDALTGRGASYFNPGGNKYRPIQDTSALTVCE